MPRIVKRSASQAVKSDPSRQALAVEIAIARVVETQAAIVPAKVTAKETEDATAAVVESGEAGAVKAAAMKAAAEAAFRASGSGEQDHQQHEKRA